VNAYFLSFMHQVFLFCFFDQAIAPDPYRQFIKRSIQAARQNCAIKKCLWMLGNASPQACESPNS
jgi:hypothetical protein